MYSILRRSCILPSGLALHTPKIRYVLVRDVDCHASVGQPKQGRLWNWNRTRTEHTYHSLASTVGDSARQLLMDWNTESTTVQPQIAGTSQMTTIYKYIYTTYPCSVSPHPAGPRRTASYYSYSSTLEKGRNGDHH